MKFRFTFVVGLTLICLLAGCANPSSDRKKEAKPSWQNLYAGNPELAGIAVWQSPREGAVYESKTPYIKGHPAEIDYFFWDGRIYGTTFFANGEAWDKGWWPNKIKAGDDEWNNVDFSYGSDPPFQTHKDPRKR